MCFNWYVYDECLKVTLTSTVEKAHDVLKELDIEVVDCAELDEQGEIFAVLDAIIDFLNDKIDEHREKLCPNMCVALGTKIHHIGGDCEIKACEEDVKSILDLTGMYYEIDRISEIVEITYFDGRVY